MRTRLAKLAVGGVLALAVTATACTSTTTSSSGAAPTPSSSGAPMVGDQMSVSLDQGAPALVQTLTDQLDGHVYLASIAIATGLGTGLDSPEFKAAATTLDQNSQDLADSIASVYGKAAGNQFLKLWRTHIGFFVDYTAAKAAGNEQGAKKALAQLDQYREDFGAFIESATGGELSADATAQALQMHVDSLVEAIDAAVAGDPGVFDKIYTAATEHMPMTASALAGAIAAQMPDQFPTS